MTITRLFYFTAYQKMKTYTCCDIDKLLTRDQFREKVFARDNHKCVFCDNKAVDAHHIIERRLFACGGYHLNNGASVCEHHHLQCEMTLISVDDVRNACGITQKIVPPHLYDDHVYDKWGNEVITYGVRSIGELFFDESVQKILKQGNVLQMFSQYVKFPRTHHLQYSPGVHSDDRVISTMEHFKGKRCILSKKMDGENTTMYSNDIHARSIDGQSHPSQDWVKQYWSMFAHDMPERWRICGENLYAQHSIPYELDTYFMGFSVWNEYNVCLDWDQTLEWFQLLGITPVQVLYDGVYDEKKIRDICQSIDTTIDEGAVLRIADEIPYGDYRHKVAKWVRKGHVQTVKHWRYGQPIVPNKLKKVKQ